MMKVVQNLVQIEKGSLATVQQVPARHQGLQRPKWAELMAKEVVGPVWDLKGHEVEWCQVLGLQWLVLGQSSWCWHSTG